MDAGNEKRIYQEATICIFAVDNICENKALIKGVKRLLKIA